MANQILSQIYVDRDAPLPIHYQLQEQLERLIVSGIWRFNEPLPSEKTLADHLQISVMTVRQAMAQLVNKGLIYREKGRGTFITPQPLSHRLQRLESFTEDMRARALETSSRTLLFETIPVPETVATRLALDHGAEIVHIRRLRLVEGRPVALHDAYVNCLTLRREELDTVGSLYLLLEQKGIELWEADETLEAIGADEEMARLLGVAQGTPLLKASRLTWNREHMPIEDVIAFYRADFYRYEVRLRR